MVDEGISESFQRPCSELNVQRSHRVAETRDYTPPSAFGAALMHMDQPKADGNAAVSLSCPVALRSKDGIIGLEIYGFRATRRWAAILNDDEHGIITSLSCCVSGAVGLIRSLIRKECISTSEGPPASNNLGITIL